jgi:hypothetical protein
MSVPTVPDHPTEPSVPTEVLERLATGIHLGHADQAARVGTTRLISLAPPPDEAEADPPDDAIDVGFCELPGDLQHRTDPLVGFRAPSSWLGIGLVTTGRAHRLDGLGSDPTRTLTVCLWPRHGRVVTVLGPPGDPLDPLVERPEGLMADVLARILALPTPDPLWSTSAFVEITWLERLAQARRPRPGRPRSWRWLADHHPLRGTGATPSPGELADRTRLYGVERSWDSFLERHAATPLPASVWGPPGGAVLPLGDWFDAGSISRWVFRHLPPPEVLVTELVNQLTPPVARDLLAALREVDTSHAPPV